jgi:hypothetical protein
MLFVLTSKRWAVDINEYACESLKLFATAIPMKKRNQDCTLKYVCFKLAD